MSPSTRSVFQTSADELLFLNMAQFVYGHQIFFRWPVIWYLWPDIFWVSVGVGSSLNVGKYYNVGILISRFFCYKCFIERNQHV